MSDETLQFFERLKAYAHLKGLGAWDLPLADRAVPEVNLPYGFEIGRQLRESVKAITQCTAELTRLVGAPLSERNAALVEHIEDTATRIAVVGQIKAGKSSFINALIGRTEFLPTHVNPWTAVPTKLYFNASATHQTGASFEFFSEAEWARLSQSVVGPVISHDQQDAASGAATARTVWRRALVRLGERYHHLLGEHHRYERITPKILSHYLCVGPPVHEPSRSVQAGRYADITRLAHVYLPAAPFVSPTILIDTPGLNDPTFIRIKTTQNILEYADVYIVILTASQPLAFTDIALLRQLRGLQKRRFLVFINRIDELDGGLKDVQEIEGHVRSSLRREFPGTEIPVLSGSALWANAANDGSDDQLRTIAASRSFRATMRKGAPPPGDIDALRSLIFDASGLPDLGEALSELMLASFLAGDGARAMGMLSSAAEVTASAAKRELQALRQLTKKSTAPDLNPGIVQLEKRLNALSAARTRITHLIAGSQEQIQSLCKGHCATIRSTVENAIAAFAASQKLILLRQSQHAASSRWRCDTSSLLNQLETEFLQLLTAAMRDIASVHEQCLSEVKRSIEQPHVVPERPLGAHEALHPDLRRALPSLGKSIDIEIGQPWWLSWWGSKKSFAEKADEFERQIQSEFGLSAERLVALAEDELGAFAEHACSTIAEVASGTISSTSTRLLNLRERLLQHTSSKGAERVEMANGDYARSVEEIRSVIGKCEAIVARLNAIGPSGRWADAGRR